MLKPVIKIISLLLHCKPNSRAGGLDMRKLLVVTLLTLLTLSFGLICYEGFAEEVVNETKRDYVIASNDILEISVYGEPDLSVTSRVAQDGTINYALLGKIKAAGLTVKQLEQNITELLGQDYLIMPQASIFVKEYSKISIIGQVNHPGSYETKENLTLTKAIALAGGFTDLANAEKVKIIREAAGNKEIIEVDVNRILDKAEADVSVKSDDTILVEDYGNYFIMGQVLKPGAYNLTKGLTVMGAISLAGGFTPVAAPNGTRVIHVEDGKKKTIRVPAGDLLKGASSLKDIPLQPDDTVVVPESFF